MMRKPCKRCRIFFFPTGKHSKICDKCKDKTRLNQIKIRRNRIELGLDSTGGNLVKNIDQRKKFINIVIKNNKVYKGLKVK